VSENQHSLLKYFKFFHMNVLGRSAIYWKFSWEQRSYSQHSHDKRYAYSLATLSVSPCIGRLQH
jgi:hypothetical protein